MALLAEIGGAEVAVGDMPWELLDVGNVDVDIVATEGAAVLADPPGVLELDKELELNFELEIGFGGSISIGTDASQSRI